MIIDRASVEEGAGLAAEAAPYWNVREVDTVALAYIEHANPEHYAELARELQRLWRVEEAMRWIAANCAEPHAQAIADGALADPAAEEGDG